MKIDDLWYSLRGQTIPAQRRVDSTHPLDLYADFEPPDHPGLILFCPSRPPDFQLMKAIGIERRQRQDGRWSLRVSLQEPKLMAVFTELCRDIIDFTRTGIDPIRAGSVVLARIDRWRDLLTMEPGGLNASAQRGLIGELLILEKQLLPVLDFDHAVSAWTGPLGMDQDFRLPSGQRIEVKAVDRDANSVIINGLGQLDGGGDPVRLAVVRLEDTGRNAPGATTVSLLIEGLRKQLADTPTALKSFNNLLHFVGWDDTGLTNEVIVRLVQIDEHEVSSAFPHLTTATVPTGVVAATYEIMLPRAAITHDK